MKAPVLQRLWKRTPRSISMLDGYARWAPKYPPRPHNPLMEAEASVVGPLFDIAAPRRALDVGTGTGRNIRLLLAAGARVAVGVDLSPTMLAHGADAAPRVRGDARQLPFRTGSFNVVSSSLMCGDLPDLAGWIGESARVLVPGGHLIYSDFHPSWSIAGWRRTFVGDDGREYELPFYPHPIEQHMDLLNRHGLEIRAIREPKLPKGEKPVVVVLHAVKPLFRTR